MGRRSSHTAEELRELIIQAATELIEQAGLKGLSAREIARKIGYSPGTLYNVFADIDDLVLTIEYRLLDRLSLRLEMVPCTADAAQHLGDLAQAYFAFTQERPRLWNLLFEHHMPSGWKVPQTLQARMDAVLTVVEQALRPLIVPADPDRTQRAARVVWASVHGIASLATAEKLTHITQAQAGLLVQDLVRTYVAGLHAELAVTEKNTEPKKKRR
ncbi:MAG: TetR/AcrR family transcriptional regulator [Hyphomicrobiaceae bacterium]